MLEYDVEQVVACHYLTIWNSEAGFKDECINRPWSEMWSGLVCPRVLTGIAFHGKRCCDEDNKEYELMCPQRVPDGIHQNIGTRGFARLAQVTMQLFSCGLSFSMSLLRSTMD